MQKLTKFKFIQLILVVAISFPLGFYIHNKLSEKINLIVYAPTGKIIFQNICNNSITQEPIEIISRGDVLLLEKKAASEFLASPQNLRKMRLEIGYLKKEGVYKIAIGGFVSDLDFMKNEATALLRAIGQMEKHSFLVKYADTKLRCGTTPLPAYGYSPPENEVNIYEVNHAFSKFHINLMTISPFIILFILFSLYHYINSNIKISFTKK
jgi:hypothetical protein